MNRDTRNSPTEDGGNSTFSLRPSDTRLSPDQTIRLDLLINEWSPSLWTHAPRVTEVATGRIMLDLWGTSWDADAAWIGTSGLRLDMRRYDRSGAFTILIDFAYNSFRIAKFGGEARPLADIRRGMDEAFRNAHQSYLDSLVSKSAIAPCDTLEAPPTLQRNEQYFVHRLRKLLQRIGAL